MRRTSPPAHPSRPTRRAGHRCSLPSVPVARTATHSPRPRISTRQRMTDLDRTVHTIPVPVGWSPEQTWEHLTRGNLLEHPNGDPAWTNVEIEGLTTEPLSNGDEQVIG